MSEIGLFDLTAIYILIIVIHYFTYQCASHLVYLLDCNLYYA